MAHLPSTITHPCDHLTGDYKTWLSRAVNVDVVVIGGGVAGLSALNTLFTHGVKDILLLEAQDRLGGRVHTIRQDGVLVEEGAEWIHGGEQNSLYRLATKLDAVDTNLPDDAWDHRFVTQDGRLVDSEVYELAELLMNKCKENGMLVPFYNTSYGQYYIDRIQEAYRPGNNTASGKALLHYLEHMVNYEEGTGSWQDMSARDADQFINYGDDHQWQDGYDTLISQLTVGIPDSTMKLSSPVCKIFWDTPDQARVLVVTLEGDTFLAQHVIVTASIGHIRERHKHIFSPELPASLVTAFMAVHLGVANKVQVGWDEPWWGTDPLDLHIIWTTFDLPLDMSWLYGEVNIYSIHRHRGVLQLFVTGANSIHVENLPEDIIKKHVLYLLKRVTGENIPQPTFFRRSRWSSNPWTRGSYSSYITVSGAKAGIHHRDQLAVPLTNSKGKAVVVWAGEHTHNTRYGTVDGAMDTGKREALRIVSLIKSSSSLLPAVEN
ncbi:peroxisomal N(1)-acetyl-spermine/spermidine oxidase-like isoform X2 [Homarus americanus]|uniref:peroxisomal N(1)-acetyl-spermine/spermidine oxidase-like isoform X2 n=1 Tax=Homarus americanus TaxID=6706 RepID=UPI001C4911ED|nr:peroxisomal N(1)-acetyl-spermine/spermidine oxidase-like isoform X2 [Homarus americanus]